MIGRFKGWCLGTRLLVTATLIWLVLLTAHALLTGRWWLWLIAEAVPPVSLVLVPMLLLVATPLARPVRHWLAPLLAVTLAAGAYLSGVDIRATPKADAGQPVTVFSWSTDIWHMGENPATFYAYLRSKDADIYLLQEYLYWSGGPVRLNELARLHAEFPAYDIRVEGELVALSRFPIVATYPRPVGDGSQWYWKGNKAQRIDVSAHGRVLSLYNVHLQVPLRVEQNPLGIPFYRFVHQQSASRHKELARLREDLAANTNPAIVAGDFNSAWMGTLIDLGDQLVSHDPVTSAPLLSSWPTATYGLPRLWRLDWLFTTADVSVHDYRFTPSLSDHSAQEIRISLKEDADAIR